MSQSRVFSSNKEGYYLGKYKIDYLEDKRNKLYKVVLTTSENIRLEKVSKGEEIYKESDSLRSGLFIKNEHGERFKVGYKNNLLKFLKHNKKSIMQQATVPGSLINRHKKPISSIPIKPSSFVFFSNSSPAISETKKMVAYSNDHIINMTIGTGYSWGKIVKDMLDKASKMDQCKDYLKIYNLVKEAAFTGGKLQSLNQPLTRKIVLSIKKMNGYDFLEAFLRAEVFFKSQQQLAYLISRTPGTLYNYPKGKRKELSPPSLFDSPFKKANK